MRAFCSGDPTIFARFVPEPRFGTLLFPLSVRRYAALSAASRYEGHYVDGTQTGMGIMTWADGRRYEGCLHPATCAARRHRHILLRFCGC